MMLTAVITQDILSYLILKKTLLILWQDSKKLGKFQGKWDGETETWKLNKVKEFEPGGELQDLISHNQGQRTLESEWFIPLLPNQRIHSLNLPGGETENRNPIDIFCAS